MGCVAPVYRPRDAEHTVLHQSSRSYGLVAKIPRSRRRRVNRVWPSGHGRLGPTPAAALPAFSYPSPASGCRPRCALGSCENPRRARGSPRPHRQREGEGRALAELALRPDGAAV